MHLRNMKQFVVIMAVIGVISTHILYREYREYRQEMSYLQPTSYTQAVGYYIDHKANVCRTDSDFFNFAIKLAYVREQGDEIDYVGLWEPSERRITLVEDQGTNVSVVAHEVHHMVETMMEEYHVRDPHYAAYLQGTFTECMMSLLQEDN